MIGRNTGTGARRPGYRIKPKASLGEGILVEEGWYDARVVFVADAPQRYEESKLEKTPFKRYSIAFEIVTEEGMRGRILCTLPWPLDEAVFSRKSAVWVLANTLLGEGYMERVTSPHSEEYLDTGDWLGRRLQIYPTVGTFRGEKRSRVVVNTFSGQTHIRTAREVDPTSTELLWERARSLGAPASLMPRILKEFSIPTPDPRKWLLAEQRLVNRALESWIGERRQVGYE